MKVIFVKDVTKVAQAGETKEVANGYARNYLIPQGIAVAANAQAAEYVKAQIRARARQQAETEAEMQALGEQLEGKELTLEARVGAQEQLYGSITNADIAAGLESKFGLAVDKRKIELDEPIRQLGSHEIAIKLTKDVTPTIRVNVTGKTEEEAG
jgi:large subunit ribosomal protein L9